MKNLNYLIENTYNIKVNKIEKSSESSVGNVFIIFAKNGEKFVIKIYNDIKHVKNMINIHTKLYNSRNISSKSNTD